MTLREIQLPATAEAPEQTPASGRRRLPGLLVLLVTLAVAVLGVLSAATPPDPLPADAPAAEFSATRAHADVEQIAAGPRPVGSAAHDRVRDQLVQKLRGLGLDPVVHKELGVDRTPGHTMAAPVQNIEATLPGSDPTGRVLVVAHYDSVEIGPGATDDAHGVATLLETVRALRSGPAPRNDITVLFTDAEEPGLMGARGRLAAADRGDPDRTVVLNLESRGTSGRAVMFETGAHNAALVPALADHVPVTTSLAYEVYRLLPNNTDFTVFREAGFTGMNFANVGTSANYDTPQDNLANSSKASLQDMGATVLSATRSLAAADIAATGKGGEATYFTLGPLLVRYPGALVLLLAGISVAASAFVVWFALRRRAVGGRALTIAAATVPLPLITAAAVGWAGWQLMTLVRPHYTGFIFGDPYRPGPTALGLCLVTAAAVWVWATVLRRRCGSLELTAAVTCWLTFLTLLTALLVPGASYLFLWPALTGAAGFVTAVRLPASSPWRTAVAALPAVPGAALLAPMVALLFAALGLVLAMVPLVVLVLLVALLAAPFARPVARRPLFLGAGAAVLAGVVVCGIGVARDGTDSGHPSQVSMVYVADGKGARWVSSGRGSHPWLDPYVDADTISPAAEFPYLKEPDEWRTGPAPRVEAPAPTARVLSTRREADGSREVTVRIGSAHGAASQLMLYADTGSGDVRSLTVAGEKWPGGNNRPGVKGRWGWGFTYVAPPSEGVELRLKVAGDGPLRLRLLAKSAGFPEGALAQDPPADLAWAAWDAGFTLVATEFTV